MACFRSGPVGNVVRNSVKVWSLGSLSYQPALRIQELLVERHLRNKKEGGAEDCNVLLLVEHKPVYTIGIRKSGYSDEEEKRLKALGAEFYRTNRGGLITFHGPGQLVAYPIIDLNMYTKSVKWYVCKLEETVIQMCKAFKIESCRSADTGVWVGDNKICAIGVHGTRYITSHGLALNCNVDLSWYSHVVPCGIADKGVTSLTRETDRTLSITDAVEPFLSSFGRQFTCDLQPLTESVRSHIVDQLRVPGKCNIDTDTADRLMVGNTWLKDGVPS